MSDCQEVSHLGVLIEIGCLSGVLPVRATKLSKPEYFIFSTQKAIIYNTSGQMQTQQRADNHTEDGTQRNFSVRRYLILFAVSIFIFIPWGLHLLSEYDTRRAVLVHSERLNADNTSKPCVHSKHFQDILLVIVYHYPYYESFPLLQEFYGEAFKNITVCGPLIPKEKWYSFLKVDIEKGYYSYECLGKAIRRFPQYRGYLFINDDMIVNWWVLQKFNLQKIWLSKDRYRVADPHNPPSKDEWPWWTDFLPRCGNALTELFRNANSQWSNSSLRTFLNNNNSSKLCTSTWADFYYIPGRLANKFQALSAVFFRHKVFLEIAVPTICYFLEKKTNIILVDGVYLPSVFGHKDFHDGRHFWRVYNYSIPFVHPVKFHHDPHSVNKEMFYLHVLPFAKRKGQCLGVAAQTKFHDQVK